MISQVKVSSPIGICLVKAIEGGSRVKKKSCLVIFKDLNDLETLLFTGCQNSILVKSYCNFNFGILVGSLINSRTKIKFSVCFRQNFHTLPFLLKLAKISTR